MGGPEKKGGWPPPTVPLRDLPMLAALPIALLCLLFAAGLARFSIVLK